MSKDPAVLFYTSDFLTGIMLMSNEQAGKYIKLLCLQHQQGHLSLEDMIDICIVKDEKIFAKFLIDKDGKYFNKRMDEEILKRKNYSKSRANNRIGKTKRKKHMKNISLSYEQHMENENENENEIKNENINAIKNEKEKKHRYGEYKHVLLQDSEYNKLQDRFGVEDTEIKIKQLDEGIELKGYKYKSHYLAILKWSEKDERNRQNSTGSTKQTTGKYTGIEQKEIEV